MNFIGHGVREIGDAVQRSHYTQQLARLVQVPDQTIAQEVSQKRFSRTRTKPIVESATPRVVSKLEEYCLLLVLHTPEHLSRINFLQAEDFDEPDCRALFLALREFGKPSEFFDRDAFHATLDESLAALSDRLTEQAQNLGDKSEPDLAREIENTAHRLRLQHDKIELSQIEVLMRDKDDERSADEEQYLRERVIFLQKRLMDSQKALSARTILGRLS